MADQSLGFFKDTCLSIHFSISFMLLQSPAFVNIFYYKWLGKTILFSQPVHETEPPHRSILQVFYKASFQPINTFFLVLNIN